jgi:F-type H+-transporting ATPase subunit delta
MEELTTTQVIEGYAVGLLEIAAAEGGKDVVADELSRIARAFERSEELRNTLSDIKVPVELKKAAVTEILDGRASKVSIALINLLVGAGRSGDFVAIADRMAQLAAEREELTLAEVRAAIELDEATVARLEARLAEATGKRVKVKVVVDPSVVGGVVTKIGDTVFDGSVKSRLQELREAWG